MGAAGDLDKGRKRNKEIRTCRGKWSPAPRAHPVRALGTRDTCLTSYTSPPAGVTATLVCFPLDVVRTRLMAGAVAGPRYGAGPFTTLAGILKHEGAPALYSGAWLRASRRSSEGRGVAAHGERGGGDRH